MVAMYTRLVIRRFGIIWAMMSTEWVICQHCLRRHCLHLPRHRCQYLCQHQCQLQTQRRRVRRRFPLNLRRPCRRIIRPTLRRIRRLTCRRHRRHIVPLAFQQGLRRRTIPPQARHGLRLDLQHHFRQMSRPRSRPRFRLQIRHLSQHILRQRIRRPSQRLSVLPKSRQNDRRRPTRLWTRHGFQQTNRLWNLHSRPPGLQL